MSRAPTKIAAAHSADLGTQDELIRVAQFGAVSQQKMLNVCQNLRDALLRKDDGPACDGLLQIKALLHGFAPGRRDLRVRRNWWERLWRLGAPRDRLGDRYHSIQFHIDRFCDELLRAETAMRREIAAVIALQKQAEAASRSLIRLGARGAEQLAIAGSDAELRAALDWRLRDLAMCSKVAQHCLPALLPEQDQDMAFVRSVHKIQVKDLPQWERQIRHALEVLDDAPVDLRAIATANSDLDRGIQHALDAGEKLRALRQTALAAIGEIIRVLSQAQAATAARVRGLQTRVR
jgi:uncharacterized protein YaaN involved in tellurite resistance